MFSDRIIHQRDRGYRLTDTEITVDGYADECAIPLLPRRRSDRIRGHILTLTREDALYLQSQLHAFIRNAQAAAWPDAANWYEAVAAQKDDSAAWPGPGEQQAPQQAAPPFIPQPPVPAQPDPAQPVVPGVQPYYAPYPYS